MVGEWLFFSAEDAIFFILKERRCFLKLVNSGHTANETRYDNAEYSVLRRASVAVLLVPC
jgi:Ser/Thr protein kinase RdoA (MazF antagonist)